MITDKIKNVFKFVEFLNSNAENFKSYIPVVENCLSVTKEMSKLKPNDNFKDKIKYNELNEIKNNEFDKVYKNVTKTITGKALELNICHLNNSSYEFNWGLQEIQTLKDNAVENDLPVILKAEKKYLEYRKNVDCDFLSLTFFFSRLDEYLKELFTFLNPTTKSEFEAFETETMRVNNIGEAAILFKQGHKKFTLPNNYLNPPQIQQQNINLNDFINENKNNALKLNLSEFPTINNVLQQQKDKLRDAEFESEFTEVKEFAEKGVKELKHKIQLHLRNGLIGTYSNMVPHYLWEIRLLFEYKEILRRLEDTTLPPQPITKQNDTLSNLITHQKSVEIVEAIKIRFKNIKGKRLKLLLLAFQDLSLLPKERIAQKFYDCCKTEFDWNIASYNAMNGYNYNKSTDSDEFTTMKQYIETLKKTN